MTALPRSFVDIPLAHRALHDRDQGRPENSTEAIRAAVEAGYGVELDLQISSDRVAMVFHDYTLDRLTGQTGAVNRRPASALGQIKLTGGASAIPTLAQALSLIGGRVPVLLELKDQDGDMGRGGGDLERAVASVCAAYTGDLALMSFNPHTVRRLGKLLPDRSCGLTTCTFDKDNWPELTDRTRRDLRQMPDFDDIGASFISHRAARLDWPPVLRLKSRAVPVLCWTVKSSEQEDQARRIADNITFEGYLPPFPRA